MKNSKQNSSRGQATLEFTVLLMFATMIFTTMFIVLGQRLATVTLEQEEAAAMLVQDRILDEIKLAMSVEDGYHRRFQLPKTINGKEYNLTVERHKVLVLDYNDNDYTRFLPTYVMGGFCFDDDDKESNFYEVAIEKQEGMVSVSSTYNASYPYTVCANAEDAGLCIAFSTPPAGIPGFKESCCRDHCRCCP